MPTRSRAWSDVALLVSSLGSGCDSLKLGSEDEAPSYATMYVDIDRDGFGAPGPGKKVPSGSSGYAWNRTDCDDHDRDVYPGASETCNDEDDDCDGETDEGLPQSLLYRDADLDGYGDPADSRSRCEAVGWADNGEDCLHTDEGTNPGVSEDCANGHDDDCDGLLDCEDDGCAMSRDCGELDCADGLDDEGDGYADCKDDECWGDTACPGVVASHVLLVGYGMYAVSENDFWSRSSCGSVTHTMRGESTNFALRVERVEGSARVHLPGEEDARLCAWGVDEVTFRRGRTFRRTNRTADTSSTWATSARDGFWITGSCGLTGSGFLPELDIFLDDWSAWYDGADWYNRERYGDDTCGHPSSHCANCDSWGGHYQERAMRYGYDEGPGARDAVTTGAYGPL